jgi:hypothetical protein
LVTLKPLQWRLAGRAVHPDIGDLAHPPHKMRLQLAETAKTVSGNGVVLYIANAPLVL